MSETNVAVDHSAEAKDLIQHHPLLAEKIAAATGLGVDEAGAMFTEVLRFLALVDGTKQVLTPPHILDMAWHEFILFTRVYSQYCQQRFGRYIHHTPGGDEGENRSQLRRTLKRYQLRFGPPDPRYWGEHGYYGEPADCGACETH